MCKNVILSLFIMGTISAYAMEDPEEIREIQQDATVWAVTFAGVLGFVLAQVRN